VSARARLRAVPRYGRSRPSRVSRLARRRGSAAVVRPARARSRRAGALHPRGPMAGPARAARGRPRRATPRCARPARADRRGRATIVSSTFCCTVSDGSRWCNWNTNPTMSRRNLAGCLSAWTGMSSTKIEPEVGLSRLPISCSSVVLPDPDGPVRATSSPGSTRKLTSRRISAAPCARFTSSRTIRDPGIAPRPSTLLLDITAQSRCSVPYLVLTMIRSVNCWPSESAGTGACLCRPRP